MTREEITNACLQAIDQTKCLLALLSTGVGKTKITIDCINKICNKVFSNGGKGITVLIVVDKRVHFSIWENEFTKWGGIKATKVQFCCYASLHKYANSYWDIVVLDECHHVGSNIRLSALKTINITYNIIGLSATVSIDLKEWFKSRYQTTIINCTTKNAIKSNILPDPIIYLMPLVLDNSNPTELYKISKKNKKSIYIRCTKRQYLSKLNELIEFYKRKTMSGNYTMRNLWLRACNDRLIYLANAKNDQIQKILAKLKNYRTVTFCSNIAQSKILGKNCIHSKNKSSQDILDSFNKGEINHITACNMLNEGINLTDCKYGIFANINASETIQIQRVGRSLRHKSPVLIIPFYKETREEEIVRKWMENYNKDFIKIIYKKDEL